jgi:hypothetical protein
MSFRAYLTWRSIVLLTVIVGGLFSLTIPKAPPVAASPDITIHLTNAPSYCVNRKGGNNSHGATVFLWACSGGQNHWYEANAYYGVVAPPACAANQCIVFEDYWNRNSCFGLGPNDTGTLGSCTNILQFWIYESGNILRNAYWGQDLVTGNDADGSKLVGNPTPIDWHQWSGP